MKVRRLPSRKSVSGHSKAAVERNIFFLIHEVYHPFFSVYIFLKDFFFFCETEMNYFKQRPEWPSIKPEHGTFQNILEHPGTRKKNNEKLRDKKKT